MTSFYGVPATRCVTRYGTMLVPAQDQVIGRSLSFYGEWAEHEIETIARYLQDGGGIVDVGANIGTHSMAFASRFPGSTIYAFEPQPFSFMLLANNVVQNALDNVQLFNVACAAETQVVNTVFDYEKIDANHGSLNLDLVVTQATAAVPLAMGTLDAMVGESDIQFVKIDVEGQELQVLLGMAQILSEQRPIVYVEVLEIERLAAIRSVLLDHGYDLRWLETAAFNKNNQNGQTENIWSHCEIGILAFPDDRGNRDDLPPVTGSEVAIPVFLDPLHRHEGGSFDAVAVERRRANDAVERCNHLQARTSSLEGEAQALRALAEDLTSQQRALATFQIETDAARALANRLADTFQAVISRVTALETDDAATVTLLRSDMAELAARHDCLRDDHDALLGNAAAQALALDTMQQELLSEREQRLRASAVADEAVAARRDALNVVADRRHAELSFTRKQLADAQRVAEEQRANLERLLGQIEDERQNTLWKRIVSAVSR